MPELPEVETVCRGLNATTSQQKIISGEVLLTRSIAYPILTKDFLSGVTGKTIDFWERRGKYLLAKLTKSRDSSFLGVHLRMTGQLLWCDQTAPLPKHTRVRLFFANNKELRFVDQRTFGKLWWISSDQAVNDIITGLKKMGPEPLTENFSLAYLIDQLKHRQKPIKNALLDQEIVAGIGNIYADEVLFLAGILPTTLCASLTKPQVQKLHSCIMTVLEKAIALGGTTFSDFLNVEGVNGNYGGVAWVYGRDGEACRVCGKLIERVKLGGRSCHFCPHCQR